MRYLCRSLLCKMFLIFTTDCRLVCGEKLCTFAPTLLRE
nr:MAG TPA: hypothetical protein [Caudoviricetes sp.]